MSTTYAGANSYPTSVTIPSDGDVKGAATVNVALEGLADRTRYLRGFIDGTSPPTLLSPTLTGTITVLMPILGDGTHLFVSQAGETTHVLGALTVGESATFSGDTSFPASHTADFHGTVRLYTTVSLLSPALLTVQAGATLQIYGNVNAAGPVNLTGKITPAGSGGIAARPFSASAAGGGTYGVTDGNRMRILGALAGDISHVITSASAYEGAEMMISLYPLNDNGHTVTFQQDGGTPLVVLMNTPGQRCAAHLIFEAGAWAVYQVFTRPT